MAAACNRRIDHLERGLWAPRKLFSQITASQWCHLEQYTAEERLLFGILQQAWFDVGLASKIARTGNQRLARRMHLDVRRYLDADECHVTAFDSICERLGFCAETMRNAFDAELRRKRVV